ncbi:MAG: ABC transporter ATP-binding protein [Anaerolineae bacterium]
MSSDNNLIIKIENLTKQFGQITAIDGLNLSVKKSEIFGLVGPDGAGKTTTIRILAAIMSPTEGRASVAGYDTMKDGETIKHHIGYMAQQFNLYGDLSVLENLNFFADIFAVRGRVRRERVDKLLHFARLTEFTGRRAGHLSGGMKKKLALACSLIHEPDILFLDEPTTGVDPVSRREFWDILADLHIQGVTILVSTPYMDEAERCSRVGLMYNGRLIECDTPAELKGLVAGELLELKPVSDTRRGVGLLNRAKQTVAALEGIIEVQTFGDLLHIFVDDAGARQTDIVQALQQADIQAHNLRRTRPRMEEAFISLVRKQKEEAQP